MSKFKLKEIEKLNNIYKNSYKPSESVVIPEETKVNLIEEVETPEEIYNGREILELPDIDEEELITDGDTRNE